MLRGLLLGLTLGSLALPGLAAEPEALQRLRHGYAFDQPEVLVRQQMFGLAHGVSLLAASCIELPQHAIAVENAYALWHRGQLEAIDDIVHALAEHYFGPRAGEAEWIDLVRALNLKNSIEDVLGQVSLDAACASLPQALTQDRYDLARTLAEEKNTDERK